MDSPALAGITSTEQVLSFEQGQTQTIAPLKGLKRVPPGYLRQVQKCGYVQAKYDTKWQSQISEVENNPLEAPSDWILVNDQAKAGVLLDLNDAPFPMAIRFNHLKGYTDDLHYDLDALIEHLQRNPQITSGTPQHDATPTLLKKESIPGEVKAEGATQYVQFVFCPTVNEMTLMWDTAKELNPTFPGLELHWAMFQLDLLGLRAAGISKTRSYFYP